MVHIKINYLKLKSKKIKALIPILLVSLVVGCQTVNAISDEEIKELVHYYGTEDTSGETAYTTSEHLIIVKDDDNEIRHKMPKDEFFVSIAPYINKTHPCSNHVLTGCQAELTNKDFNIILTNQSGEEILKEVVTSGDNGFIDLWLPRNETYTINIEFEGKTNVSEFSTFKDSNTCISNFKLT